MEPVQKSDPKPTRSGIETLLSLPESMQLPPPDPTTPEHAAVIFSVSENPGYAALGFSRIIAIGAPVASCGRSADSCRGRVDFLVTPGSERIPCQYAVVEAERLLSVKDPGDLFSPGSGSDAEEEPLLVVAGYLRAVGLEKAYREGHASEYREELLRDAGLYRLERKVIESLRQPVLVRLIPAERVSPALAASSNMAGYDLSEVIEKLRQEAENPGKQPELLPELAAPQPIPVLWLDAEGRPTLASLLEFVRRRPASEQKHFLNTEGLPVKGLKAAFLKAELLSAYGDRARGLFSDTMHPESASRVADALLAALPLATALEAAGTPDIVRLLADAAEYASSFAEPPQALSARLIQGELAVQPAVELWLFAALNADQADRIAFCRYARGLSEMLARRAGRKARLTLSRQLAADFTAWLEEKVPPRMSAFLLR